VKIYLPGGSLSSRTIYVQPGKERSDNSAWFARDSKGKVARNANGEKEAILFPVKFRNGSAEVDSALGQYIIDKGLASATPIVIASHVPATSADAEPPKRTLRVYR